jgi:hypothetical protein
MALHLAIKFLKRDGAKDLLPHIRAARPTVEERCRVTCMDLRRELGLGLDNLYRLFHQNTNHGKNTRTKYGPPRKVSSHRYA